VWGGVKLKTSGLPGLYGSGKSTVAADIAYLLERQGEPYALLDLDYPGRAGSDRPDPGCRMT
jgi:signal recognition particle GTPase